MLIHWLRSFRHRFQSRLAKSSRRRNRATTHFPISVETLESLTLLTPTLMLNSVSATEGSSLTFTVTLSGAMPGGFMVNYGTSDGTATTANNDYTMASGMLMFMGMAGETKTITVNTINDSMVEPNETLTVSLSGAPMGLAVGSPGTGTITNDDVTAPTLTLNSVSATEGSALTFTVRKWPSESTPLEPPPYFPAERCGLIWMITSRIE